jgi:hypothetical protein
MFSSNLVNTSEFLRSGRALERVVFVYMNYITRKKIAMHERKQ